MRDVHDEEIGKVVMALALQFELTCKIQEIFDVSYFAREKFVEDLYTNGLIQGTAKQEYGVDLTESNLKAVIEYVKGENEKSIWTSVSGVRSARQDLSYAEENLIEEVVAKQEALEFLRRGARANYDKDTAQQVNQLKKDVKKLRRRKKSD